MRRLILALAATVALLALPSGAGAATLTDIGDFSEPLFMAAPPGDSTRLMVVQKGGEIRVLEGGSHTLFLDVDAAIPGGIATDGEQGLLSMAFSPDYAATGRFYVYYTAADGASNNVAEFTVSSNPSVSNTTPRNVISIPHPNPPTNHNGGQIAFGPDGMLYIAPGDGAADADTAQDKTTLLGKVLRIDPRNGVTYTIPAGNPFTGPGDSGADEVYHLGLRNPFRFSFDRATGDLIIGDVGAGSREEVTLVPAGTPAGRNFGWPDCEGTCAGPQPAGHLGPALQYSQGSPRAVTGGVVVRDPALPDLNDCYVYADFYDGDIRTATLAAGAGAGHGALTGLSASNLASFSEDNANRVYVTSLAGDVFRIDPGGASARLCPLRPAGPAIPDGTTAPDSAPPRLLTRTPRRQRVLRQRGVVAFARCTNEPCNVAMTARLRIGRLSYPLLRTRPNAGANRRIRLRARLTRRASRALRRAQRRRQRARIDVAMRARDGAGNRSSLRRVTVAVRR